MILQGTIGTQISFRIVEMSALIVTACVILYQSLRQGEAEIINMRLVPVKNPNILLLWAALLFLTAATFALVDLYVEKLTQLAFIPTLALGAVIGGVLCFAICIIGLSLSQPVSKQEML